MMRGNQSANLAIYFKHKEVYEYCNQSNAYIWDVPLSMSVSFHLETDDYANG
jgi:hypothetical protein